MIHPAPKSLGLVPMPDLRAEMETRQVIVFSEKAPFGGNLAGLLHAETDLAALGWETDLDQAIQRIQTIRPPAVVVASQDADMDSSLAVTRIQNECPGLQIAEVNLESRTVRVYAAEDQIVQELKELLAAVERLGDQPRDKSWES